MFFILPTRSVRSLLAVTLAAVGFLLSVQFAASAINQVQHELGVDHDATAFEIVWTSQQDDHAHDHDASADDHDRADSQPAPHHHHADGPQVADLAGFHSQPVELSTTSIRFVAGSPRPISGLSTALDRPPRRPFEVTA